MLGYLGSETDFIKHEVRKWGYEEVMSLLDDGFVPKLTTEGWRWILPIKNEVKSRVRVGV